MSVIPGGRAVALLVETSNAYARGLLAGVREYVLAHPGWSIYLAEHSRDETDFTWLEGWRGDGVLARIENIEAAEFIRHLGLPAVDLSAWRFVPEIPGVETDDVTIARWAFGHFAERGLTNFAYCGDARFAWSLNRAAAFAEQVSAHGSEPHTLGIEQSGTRVRDRDRLAEWLRALPKPVGVFACYDIAGREVLEACKIANLPVPDAVAVIGVDNDEIIGSLTAPPLSSIQPDTIRTGYFAAQLLDQLMTGISVEPAMHLIKPLRVVARQSSDIFAVDDPLVAEALRFIRDHSDQNLDVGAVLQCVGLSRRALDLRFDRVVGRTVHGEIMRVRMARVAELLSVTDWTLPQIAGRLNFSHSEYMSVAFKRFTGKSPGEYRRTVRGGIRTY
ncbi:XylR family transcriptional regulator [Sphaerisporangium perillae]|uniref:XylR family transcriptional regulator n=1 Tax=Sphaerisporangium perillae TaxID=2935860 RepID=UPI0020100FF5|nr:DNA-binding transcriptional regulator [Sphaerisporangium perillae]